MLQVRKQNMGRYKRAINAVTDETVDYFTREWENNFFYRTGQKIYKVFESKKDDSEIEPKKQNEKLKKL